MLSKKSKVAIVTANFNVKQLIIECLSTFGFTDVQSFETTHEAYEVCSRAQYDLFIVEMDMPDNPGVTLMQRLRSTGNYGFEPMLFLGSRMNESTLNLFLEFDVDYVLMGALDKERCEAKLKYLIKTENHLPEPVQKYRDAKSAYWNGIYEMSRDLVDDLIKMGVSNERVMVLKGDILAQEQNNSEAASYYQQVLTKNPSSLCARNKLAKLKMAEGKYTEAKLMLDEMVELNPHHLKALENAGFTNFELGYDDLAKQQMAQLEKMDSDNDTANTVLTKVAIREGDYETASKRMEGQDNSQEIAEELNKAGVKLVKDEDFEGAIKVYLDCLRLIEDEEMTAKICYNLAFAYAKLKNMTKAREFCERALMADSGLEPAQKMMAQLNKQTA
ncbi:tetratricopeptide repeat protein [Pseudobacteriovorax antillogorgiicola]|uniref:Tetratricopeptide repeat-containing protein n=1 Tax=Pseudobacteriovorax antillogorgiicola TaxID=1513793 RepID=A0A1Y6B8A9_9BACT|nr:tetratricopeptide repeat protein [Pseudobacteriovorax antillogorgiicola]TCS58508.1 tetratricopeptide repeat protein [Pseudobacteriovorax antillogorgiicola]SME98145.1 Tetratricopeptide repeat-containing protein [Pseudobacteriovorax antillogorgiicola]